MKTLFLATVIFLYTQQVNNAQNLFDAEVTSIDISPSTVAKNEKPTIKGYIENNSSLNNGYNGEGTFDIYATIQYPNGSRVQQFWNNQAFSNKEKKTFIYSESLNTSQLGTYTVFYSVYTLDGIGLLDELTKNFTVEDLIGTVKIVDPNGGETWTSGTTNNISWTTSGNINSIDLQYTTDNGNSWTYIDSPDKNNSPYSWNVPSGINSTQCKVKILGYYNNQEVLDLSNNVFTIKPVSVIGNVQISSPNGGETWTSGTTNNISWTTSGNINSIDLQYTTDNGNSWTYIDSPDKNNSPYSWNVPSGINSTQCKVKILGYYNNQEVLDLSNNVFTIKSNDEIFWDTLQFADNKWIVSKGAVGPQGNLLSNSNKSVWVDPNDGTLHLKIRKIGELWYGAEIVSKESFGYGEYIFKLNSRIDQLDKNVVVGLFTYQNDGVLSTPQEKEIDIEFSKWGDANSSSNSQFLFQYRNGGNINNPNVINPKKFNSSLNGFASTHKFDWRPDYIKFQSYHGHYDELPSPTQNYLIADTVYQDSRIPEDENEKVIINFWLNRDALGRYPSNNNEAELIISDFIYKTLRQQTASKIKLTNIYVQQ